MKPFNILIAEDDAIITMDLKNILKRNQYNVAGSVSSIKDMVRSVVDKNIDLILCDLIFQSKYKFEELVHFTQKHKLPVIIITGSSKVDIIDNDSIPDTLIILKKPFDEKELLGHIKRLLTKTK